MPTDGGRGRPTSQNRGGNPNKKQGKQGKRMYFEPGTTRRFYSYEHRALQGTYGERQSHRYADPWLHRDPLPYFSLAEKLLGSKQPPIYKGQLIFHNAAASKAKASGQIAGCLCKMYFSSQGSWQQTLAASLPVVCSTLAPPALQLDLHTTLHCAIVALS